MFEITTIAGGVVIGAGLAWILERWVSLFLKQLDTGQSKEFPQPTTENNSDQFSRWIIFSGMSIAAATLSVWRQWSPELLNDLVLVTTLVGIAWIDRKTLLIEGRMVTLAQMEFVFAADPKNFDSSYGSHFLRPMKY